MGEALKIVRWDDIAVRRNAKDPRATLYAVLFWIASMLVILLATSFTALSKVLPRGHPVAMATGAAVGRTFGLVELALLTFVQLEPSPLIANGVSADTVQF